MPLTDKYLDELDFLSVIGLRMLLDGSGKIQKSNRAIYRDVPLTHDTPGGVPGSPLRSESSRNWLKSFIFLLSHKILKSFGFLPIGLTQGRQIALSRKLPLTP